MTAVVTTTPCPAAATPSRRRFIVLVPFAGATLLAACSPAPSPAPAPTPTPAPVAAPQPSPAPAPAPDVAAAPAAPATGGLVQESDAKAIALGYVTEAARADKVKFPAYAEGNKCANCALFQAAAGAAQGGCPLFAGQQVVATGWCSAWAKKG